MKVKMPGEKTMKMNNGPGNQVTTYSSGMVAEEYSRTLLMKVMMRKRRWIFFCKYKMKTNIYYTSIIPFYYRRAMVIAPPLKG